MLRPFQSTFAGLDYPDLLVGLDSPDDAAVWRIDDSRLLAVTTDFFTPVVDEPYDYGAIAAANALSDLYAMGAVPALALTVACLPVNLESEVVEAIMKGLADKVREAGAVIAGGHTIQDKEPKVGLVAIGFVNEADLLTKAGAQAGDSLFLTKPLGTGVLSTALKSGKAEADDVERAVKWMGQLNREAASLTQEHQIRSATDITGFSLLGHGLEMADASGVQLVIDVGAVPFLPGVFKYATSGAIPGGTLDNQRHFSKHVRFPSEMPDMWQILLFDAQTSGGLLMAVPAAERKQILDSAARIGVSMWEIGEVEAGAGIVVKSGGSARGAAIDELEVSYLDVS